MNPRVTTSSAAECLQQKLQRDRGVDTGVRPVNQPGVVLDDLQHADLFLQRPATEVMTDGQRVLALRRQVGPQRGCVLDMKIGRAES